jgi:hypothetical protein
MTSADTEVEFPMNDDIKQEVNRLGISKICIKQKGDTIPNSLVVYFNSSDMASVECKYHFKHMKQTLYSELKPALVKTGIFDCKTLTKIMVKLAQAWRERTEQEKKEDTENKTIYEKQRAEELARINAEIDRVKNANVGITSEQWRIGLSERFTELQNVVNTNIPEIWPALEFELSSLRILNIHDCDLPFIGLILARPSSYKTIVLNLLRKWYCTFYTDQFSPKAWITHTTAVDTEEDLRRIDMIAKVKDRHFLTPELAPLFTIKDDDLGSVLGTITRIADGHGFGSDSGAHGHREYGDTMFVWTGAAVDIPYKVYKLLAGLGFKLYFFRLPYKEKTEDELLKQMHESFSKKKASIEAALYEYLVWFEIGPDLIFNEDSGLRKMRMNTDQQDSEDVERWIIKLATLLKHLRLIAKTWAIEDSGTGQGSNYGQSESPDRAIEILRNLARGHALLTGRTYVSMEDIPIVAKVVLSTANIDKVGVLRVLISNKGKLTSVQIENALNVTRPTALRNMVELKAIGLVDMYEVLEGKNYVKMIQLKEEFSTWLCSEEFDKLREGFEPVDNRAFMDVDSKGKEEEDESTHKGESTPYTTTENQNKTFSLKQTLTFQRIFAELEDLAARSSCMSMDKTTVSGQQLQEKLVTTDEFTQNDAAIMIDDMVKEGFMEKVSWGSYRRKKILELATFSNKHKSYRKYGDTWGCENCRVTGDKFHLQETPCYGGKK